ncbi:MAG: aminopeptidase [Chloroflexia bacterium]|nr:aminopeptidase [Chloroflexia bacterium]MDQ3411296.1 aminopeptidase [Chloroflexota bacterium]
MADPRMTIWARTLVDFSVRVQPGDRVAITGGAAAEPLFRAIFQAVIERGAFPVMVPVLPGFAPELLMHGNDDQLQYISPVERFLREETDVLITVMADTNTKAMSAVQPGRQVVFQKARTKLMETFLRRSAEGSLRWVSTLFPTDAYAQDADMSTADFTDFVFAACKLGEPDPAAAWLELAAEQERLIGWLAGKRRVHLRGRDTDLTLAVEGRTWISADGTMNFPDGEIFTAPVEDAVDGHVRFSYPVVTQGREVHDVRLRFVGGRVVDASAAKNEAFLIQTLDTDPGARVLGELAIGTNFNINRFTKNILFDEKIGGTVHMAVGAGYPESGSINTSAVHWDMICDLRGGGGIDVDGEPFLRDGKFVV